MFPTPMCAGVSRAVESLHERVGQPGLPVRDDVFDALLDGAGQFRHRLEQRILLRQRPRPRAPLKQAGPAVIAVSGFRINVLKGNSRLVRFGGEKVFVVEFLEELGLLVREVRGVFAKEPPGSLELSLRRVGAPALLATADLVHARRLSRNRPESEIAGGAGNFRRTDARGDREKDAPGAASCIDPSVEERDFMDTQRAVIPLRKERCDKTILLLKTTGGGWRIPGMRRR